MGPVRAEDDAVGAEQLDQLLMVLLVVRRHQGVLAQRVARSARGLAADPESMTTHTLHHVEPLP